MLAIYKREMRAYFTGVIGYVFLVIYLAVGGAAFALTTMFSMKADVTTFFTYMMIFSAVILPLLTMKSFSEEKKVKTEHLLLTSPISLTGMVMGKFLAAYTMFFGAMTVNTLYFFFLQPYAYVKYGILFGNLLAILLVGLTFIAIGIFVSALTENQLTAAIGTIAIIAAFLLVGVVASFIPSSYAIRSVFNFLSIFTRFQGFANGYFDIASLVYYLRIAAIFLYLTVRVYDRRRAG